MQNILFEIGKYRLIALFAIVFIVSCKPNRNEPKNDPAQTGNNQVVEQTKKGPLAEPPDSNKKIDGSKLKVYGLRVAKQSMGFTSGLNISYDPDGKAAYIEIQICPLEHGDPCVGEGLCEDGKMCKGLVTPHNRYRIGVLYEGETLYKVRGCVQLVDALGIVGCGPWTKKIHNSNIFNREEADLLNKAIRIRAQLGDLGLDYREALTKFEIEGRSCTSLNAEAKRFLDSKVRVVEQLLKAPAQWFRSSAEGLADKSLGIFGADSKDVLGPVSNLKKEITEHFVRACENLGELTSEKVCTGLKFGGTIIKGMIETLNPVAPLGTLSNNLHDIVHGTFKGDRDKLVAKACYAEKNLQQRITDINRQIEGYQKELTVVKDQLERLAGHKVKVSE